MKVYRDAPKDVTEVLDVLMAMGSDSETDKHLLLVPGTFGGRPAWIIAAHMDVPDGIAMAPLAVMVTPDDADRLTMDIPGMTRTGGAPSTPSGAQDGEAVKVLRDALPLLPGVLGERAQRVLAGRPIAPAAPVAGGMGVYL